MSMITDCSSHESKFYAILDSTSGKLWSTSNSNFLDNSIETESSVSQCCFLTYLFRK